MGNYYKYKVFHCDDCDLELRHKYIKQYPDYKIMDNAVLCPQCTKYLFCERCDDENQ